MKDYSGISTGFEVADYEEGFRTVVGCSLEPMGAGSLWLRTRGPLCGSLLQGMVLMNCYTIIQIVLALK